MNIGIIKFTLRLPGNDNLKGKRRIVHSLCQKLRNQFNISVAEIEKNDDLKMAVIGISFVSNSTQIIDQLMSQILHFLQGKMGDFILLTFDQETIKGF